MTVEERFWGNVCINAFHPKGCWEWIGSFYSDGRRGRFSQRSKWHTASRVAYEIINGPITDGLFVCHRCDNPRCVRPDHLFLGTQADNMADMIKKGRQARGDKVANKGAKNGFYGKTHSEATRQKIIASNIRRTKNRNPI